MNQALDREKDLYDRKVHGPKHEIGDLVWLHSSKVPKGQSKKLHIPWSGPYRVVTQLSDTVYRIEHLQNRRKRQVVHFNRLKPCPSDIHLPPDSRTRTTPTPVTQDPPGTHTRLEPEEDPPPQPQPRYPQRTARRAPDYFGNFIRH